MKIRTFNYFFLTALVLGAFLLSCKKDDAPKVVEDKFNLSGNANGAQEVPAVTTAGTGTITGEYNNQNNLLTYTITWTGLSGAATNMHFHGPAAVGVGPAGVQIAIPGFTAAAAGTVSNTATLTDAQEIDFLAGKWYYNIHTAANGGGEIRGQVTATHR